MIIITRGGEGLEDKCMRTHVIECLRANHFIIIDVRLTDSEIICMTYEAMD